MGRKTKQNKVHRKEYDDFLDENLPFEKTQTIHAAKYDYKTPAQKLAAKEVEDNAISFLSGIAGTGKTFVAVAKAIEALQRREVKKIVVSRPTVVAGNEQGHLPGSADDKAYPFLIPIYDILEVLLGVDQMKKLISEKVIEFAGFQWMRGRTFHDSFVVLDEVQNATKTQLKLALTRIGENSKYAICYDPEQIDLKKKTDSCVYDILHFKGRKKIGFHEFTIDDVMRSEACKLVLDVYSEIEQMENIEK